MTRERARPAPSSKGPASSIEELHSDPDTRTTVASQRASSAHTIPDDIPAEVAVERAFLGAALIDQQAARVVLEVPLADYYLDRHRVIAEAVRDVVGELDRPDPVLVLDRCHAAGHAEITLDELVALFVETPSISSANRYAEIIRRRARLRRLVQAGADLAAAAGLGDVAAVARIAAEIGEIAGEEINQ